MIKVISIKVESGESEEKILNHLMIWVKDNFALGSESEISVCGKEETVRYNGRENN